MKTRTLNKDDTNLSTKLIKAKMQTYFERVKGLESHPTEKNKSSKDNHA